MPVVMYCLRTAREWGRQRLHWRSQKCLDLAINVSSLQPIHCRQTLPVLICLTERPISSNIGMVRQTVSCFWRMRSTVPHRRHSRRFWKLWKNIRSVLTDRPSHCRNPSSVLRRRIRLVLQEPSHCRNHSWTVLWSACPLVIRVWKIR